MTDEPPRCRPIWRGPILFSPIWPSSARAAAPARRGLSRVRSAVLPSRSSGSCYLPFAADGGALCEPDSLSSPCWVKGCTTVSVVIITQIFVICQYQLLLKKFYPKIKSKDNRPAGKQDKPANKFNPFRRPTETLRYC